MSRASRTGTEVPLIAPASGRPLRSDGPWSLTDGEARWPVVEGIPYLRPGRDDLRRAALDRLDSGDARGALVVLLADQDDYARIAPPKADELARLIAAVEGGSASLRDAMAALHFGPVADYFAYRWSSPTYLSGLALLDRHVWRGSTVVEVACGIGHYLRDLAARGWPCVGVDVVFAKLWLARRFLVPPSVALICGDAARGLPLGPIEGQAVAFCHDAFYFLPAKDRVVSALRAVVGAAGSIVIGHAHNSGFDHGGVSGEPKTPAEYADLLPAARLYDDAELARSAWSGEVVSARSPADLAGVEAVALAWSGPTLSWGATGDATPHPNPPPQGGRGPEGGNRQGESGGDLSPSPLVGEGRSGRASDTAGDHAIGLTRPIPGVGLRLNPLLIEEGGTLRPAWPSARFEAEYAAASPYLWGEPTPSAETLDRAAWGEIDPEIERLAIRRILLDLPERW